MNGWILLHKKIWDSPHFKHRKNLPVLMSVWVWLLTHANDDGVVTFGQKQIAEDVGAHPSSIFRALAHIKHDMCREVKYEANKLFTKIVICNWREYQRKANNEPKHNRSTTEVQPNTNKEERIKNKEEETRAKVSDDLFSFQEKFPTIDVKFEWEHCQNYYDAKGKAIKDWRAAFRNWLGSDIAKKQLPNISSRMARRTQ